MNTDVARDVGAAAPGGGAARTADRSGGADPRRAHRSVKPSAFVKLNVGPAVVESRYDACRYHVSPAIAETGPSGVGTWVRSKPVEKLPAAPELKIAPPTPRPIGPERQR